MKWWIKSSLFWRLYGIELMAVTVVWLVFGAIALVDGRRAAREQIDRDLEFLTVSLANVASPASNRAAVQALAETIRAMQVRKSTIPMELSDVTYRVWKADGTLLARSPGGDGAVMVEPGTVPANYSILREGWIIRTARSDDQSVLAVVGESTPYRSRVLHAAMRKLWYPYFALVLALAAIVWAAMRFGLHPLQDLANAVAARHESDLSPLRPARNYLELEPLINALNGTLGKIERILNTEREFFADAAHELRTPLAVISAQAHVVAQEPDQAGRIRAVKALDEGINRVAKVLQRLLQLARLDAAAAAPDTPLTDVASLIDDVVAVRSADAKYANHKLHASAPEQLMLRCNSSDLQMALDCLVDNALKYTPAGSNIWVAAGLVHDEVVLSVTDEGPGIPSELRQQAFRRFERLGAMHGEGSGLGLAIVQRVAELHGGRALILDREGSSGCRFEIRIPQRESKE